MKCELCEMLHVQRIRGLAYLHHKMTWSALLLSLKFGRVYARTALNHNVGLLVRKGEFEQVGFRLRQIVDIGETQSLQLLLHLGNNCADVDHRHACLYHGVCGCGSWSSSS